jgi:hypothetical protein
MRTGNRRTLHIPTHDHVHTLSPGCLEPFQGRRANATHSWKSLYLRDVPDQEGLDYLLWTTPNFFMEKKKKTKPKKKLVLFSHYPINDFFSFPNFYFIF